MGTVVGGVVGGEGDSKSEGRRGVSGGGREGATAVREGMMVRVMLGGLVLESAFH